MQTKQKMKLKKSTKNTHVYECKQGDENPAITTVYVNKKAVSSPPAETITVTILEGE